MCRETEIEVILYETEHNINTFISVNVDTLFEYITSSISSLLMHSTYFLLANVIAHLNNPYVSQS